MTSYPREIVVSNGRVTSPNVKRNSSAIGTQGGIREITVNRLRLDSSYSDIPREVTGVDIRNHGATEDFLMEPHGGQLRAAFSEIEGLDRYANKESHETSSKEIGRSRESDITGDYIASSSNIDTNDTQEQPMGISKFQQLKMDFAKKSPYKSELRSGKRIGFYRLILDIGRGNFSKVKLATHTILSTEVAIKVIDRRKFDAKTRKLLSQELTNMERLDHPHIVQLFEMHEVSHRWYLVMEYASAGELHSHLKRHGRMEEGVAKKISIQIVSALKHMHDREVIHRDLKAENVLLVSSNSVKLGDFGFSKKICTGDCLTTFCGSPPYAAPELFVADFYVGPAVDLWAFGVLLFYMVAGHLPFRGESIAQIKRLILDCRYTIPPFVSSECKEIIDGLLCKNIRDRFAVEKVQQCHWFGMSEWPVLTHESHPSPSHVSDENVRDLLKRWWNVGKHELDNALAEGPENSLSGIYRILRIHGKKFLEGKTPLVVKKRNTGKKSKKKCQPSDTDSLSRKKPQRRLTTRTEEVTTVDLRDGNLVKTKLGKDDERASKTCAMM